jgi:hypothetical protein
MAPEYLFFVQLTEPFTIYEIFRKENFAGAQLVSNGFDFDRDLVCKGIHLGCTPVETPIS